MNLNKVCSNFVIHTLIRVCCILQMLCYHLLHLKCTLIMEHNKDINDTDCLFVANKLNSFHKTYDHKVYIKDFDILYMILHKSYMWYFSMSSSFSTPANISFFRE